jgi:hypothetical protein
VRAFPYRFAAAAAAGIGLLGVGSAAWAQKPYPDMEGPPAYNTREAYQGGYTVYRNRKWNGRVYGSSGPDNGYQSDGHFSPGVAREQLNAKGYKNVQGLKPMHGWEAHATRNGKDVKIMLDDKDEVSTYQGK